MTAKEILARLKELPPMSTAGLKLVKLLEQPNQDNDEIVNILKRDSVLTAKLLRVCNSAFYGFNDGIASVDQAVFMMGYEKIIQIVLAICFGGPMNVALEGYSFAAKDLSHHAFVTAMAAERLAQDGWVPGIEPAAAFTAGLLHDIGKLAFNAVLSVETVAQLRGAVEESGLSRLESERKILGTDHAEVGACMLRNWKLPEDIVEGVANHHQPPLTPAPLLSSVVCLANTMAHLAGSAPGWEAYADKISGEMVAALHLTPERVETGLIDLRDSFEKVEQFLVMT